MLSIYSCLWCRGTSVKLVSDMTRITSAFSSHVTDKSGFLVWGTELLKTHTMKTPSFKRPLFTETFAMTSPHFLNIHLHVTLTTQVPVQGVSIETMSRGHNTWELTCRQTYSIVGAAVTGHLSIPSDQSAQRTLLWWERINIICTTTLLLHALDSKEEPFCFTALMISRHVNTWEVKLVENKVFKPVSC